jgi:hypothetical protein
MQINEGRKKIMSDPFEGGCACGAIRYVCAAQPVASFNCHCRACQRFTGSAFISGILVPAEAFKLTRGAPAYYTRQGDSGGDINRGFCAVCGSPVAANFSHMPDLIGIPAASLDDPSWHKPAMDMYTSHAQPWDYMNPDLPKFSAGPDPQS